ncbi:reticulon-like protein B1 isoform X2 [Miscanthus floridulus]|uniref:reticulon-like protein B1 isoform X2 n=1 Tax=Miscanthus floridulus TaxID=154761 RepID=UPI00345A9641
MMSESEEHGSLLEKIIEKIHEYKHSSSSSSSDSDDDKKPKKSKKKKLFGRKHPLHHVLGGGKGADLVLWRNKQASGSILAGVTVIWLLFEGIGYHLLTFLCHALIVFLTVWFVWSNAASFVNRSPPKFPEVILSEVQCLKVAHIARKEINEAFYTLRNVASGKDLKTYLMTIAVLWFISIVGSCFSFLTLSYTIFLMAYTLPMLYEKYEDQVDVVGEKALIEIKKQYKVIDAKLISKIPMLSEKKQH